MATRKGSYTLVLDNRPAIVGWAAVAAKKKPKAR